MIITSPPCSATGLFRGKLKSYINIPVMIVSQGQLQAKRMKEVLLERNPALPSDRAERIAHLYIHEAAAEKINHDIAFAQMLLETGFLLYGGAVSAEQFNFAGLGATDDGSPGEIFPSEELGIRAHIQHLKAYASLEPLVNPCVDRRFRYVTRGSVSTIFDLPGRWASDPHYGDKIFRILKKLFDRETLVTPLTVIYDKMEFRPLIDHTFRPKFSPGFIN